MAIRSISREEFQLLMPTHGLLRSVIGAPVEWYVDDEKKVIGTVAAGKTGKEWAYVILGREQREKFRALVLKKSLESRGAAKSELLLAMEQAEHIAPKSLPPTKLQLGVALIHRAMPPQSGGIAAGGG